MEFIKQNLFFVILVAAVVIVGGAFVLLDHGLKDTPLAAQLGRRETAARNIHGFSSGAITEDQLADLRKRVEEDKKIAQQVAANSETYNKRFYPVLTLKRPVGDTTQNIPAFPVEDKYHAAGELYGIYVQAYKDSLDGLKNSLSPVKLVTEAELTKEVAIETRRLEEENRIKRKKEAIENATSNPATKSATEDEEHPPAVRPHVVPGGRPGLPGGPGGPGGLEHPGGALEDVSAQAKDNATNALMFRQAQAGRLFVADDALEDIFAKHEPTIPDTDLWRAQLSLWVQNDIIEAINATNDYVLEKTGAKKLNVLNSAVKKLVKISVAGQYFLPAGTTTTGGGGAPTGGGLNIGGGGGPMPMPAHGGAPTGTTANEANLTGHVSNKDYDVIQYSFTVVMPDRYIPVLESKLMDRNYHTILRLEVGGQGADSSAAAAGTTVKALVPAYYGSDAVREVTIHGELLLQTSWERGTYDDAKKTWTLPPLMPPDVLRQFQGVGATTILRPEDLTRIAEPKATK